jgi:hypothetical protein
MHNNVAKLLNYGEEVFILIFNINIYVHIFIIFLNKGYFNQAKIA